MLDGCFILPIGFNPLSQGSQDLEVEMQTFLSNHEGVTGVLAGFDRILFRGLLLRLIYVKGFDGFLGGHGVLYKNFKPFVMKVSEALKNHAKEVAESQNRPLIYLRSSSHSKEDWAREIMEQDKIKEGLVCIFTCVEPCKSYAIYKNGRTKHLDLVFEERKCLHIYYYYVDEEFGLMHVRLQTWFPLNIQICLNGREYLAKALDRAGIAYKQRDNCFTWIEDLPRAQKLMAKLESRRWHRVLERMARRVNPLLYRRNPLDIALPSYYWTMHQSEYATDFMFKDRQSLEAIYPSLLKHAITEFNSTDVMRFLGRRTNSRFKGEVISDIKDRIEGTRIKHRVEENSIKMYDKQGTVLRIETTINNPKRFMVRRKVVRNGEEVIKWIPMRKGTADIRRRVEVSRAANERYIEALAAVGAPAPTRQLLDRVSKRVTRKGRNYRGLRLFNQSEAAVFQVVLSGDFLLQGFRNKDLRDQLYPTAGRHATSRKRAAGKITRLLSLLRAHRLIRKVSGTSYYRTTVLGRHIMAAALRVREIDVQPLAIAA